MDIYVYMYVKCKKKWVTIYTFIYIYNLHLSRYNKKKQYELGQSPRCLFGNMDRRSVGCVTPPYVNSPVAFDGGEVVSYSCHLCEHFYVSLR